MTGTHSDWALCWFSRVASDNLELNWTGVGVNDMPARPRSTEGRRGGIRTLQTEAVFFLAGEIQASTSEPKRTMQDRFEQIYAKNEWGCGSGEGSLPVHTRGYVRVLQRLLRRRRIATVVDLGCGDWQFSRSMNWDGIHYIGYDLVRSVIERNRAEFAAPNIEFRLVSGDLEELPTADLLITKDVLQHWSNRSIFSFLPILSRYPRWLLTNCVNPRGVTENQDITDGDFRYLDLRLPPFRVAATEIYTFSNHRPLWSRPFEEPRWTKKVLLIRSAGLNSANARRTA